MTIDPHPNLGKALLLGAAGSIILTSITCGIAVGIALGAVGAIPNAIVTCCFQDSYRLRAALVGALVWAIITGAVCNYILSQMAAG